MTMDTQHGRIVFECNTCGETFTAQDDDFGEALLHAKADGWKPYKMVTINRRTHVRTEDWEHARPNCEVPR